MVKITIEQIRSWNPCYNPGKWLPEGWTGTPVDILRMTNIPPQDRLWCVLRTECVSDKTARLFGVWCAREALKLIPNPDPRSVAACDVAERFANGQATIEELAAARAAAQAAAWDAAWAAARAAAWDAARAAAWAAARAAAWDAVRDTAWDAVRDAAWAAAWDAAWAAAWDAQCQKLAEMMNGEA